MIKFVAARAGNPLVNRLPRLIHVLLGRSRIHGVERDGDWESLNGFAELSGSKKGCMGDGVERGNILLLPEPPKTTSQQNQDKRTRFEYPALTGNSQAHDEAGYEPTVHDEAQEDSPVFMPLCFTVCAAPSHRMQEEVLHCSAIN